MERLQVSRYIETERQRSVSALVVSVSRVNIKTEELLMRLGEDGARDI